MNNQNHATGHIFTQGDRVREYRDLWRGVVLEFYGRATKQARYYSEPSEYYEPCVSGGIASQRPVTESYCIDLHNVSPLVRGVIERYGRVTA